MMHIEKNISYSPTGNNTSSARAREVDGWNVEHARHHASANGLEISDAHIDVIQFLRDYYVEHGWPKRTHELSRLLDKAYRHRGGKKYLHELFPGGPLMQAPELAGLPALLNVVDKSFGTSH